MNYFLSDEHIGSCNIEIDNLKMTVTSEHFEEIIDIVPDDNIINIHFNCKDIISIYTNTVPNKRVALIFFSNFKTNLLIIKGNGGDISIENGQFDLIGTFNKTHLKKLIVHNIKVEVVKVISDFVMLNDSEIEDFYNSKRHSSNYIFGGYVRYRNRNLNSITANLVHNDDRYIDLEQFEQFTEAMVNYFLTQSI